MLWSSIRMGDESMLDPGSDTMLRWICPTCQLEWYDRGRGFLGQRFSRCLGCGAHACEGVLNCMHQCDAVAPKAMRRHQM